MGFHARDDVDQSAQSNEKFSLRGCGVVRDCLPPDYHILIQPIFKQLINEKIRNLALGQVKVLGHVPKNPME